MICIVDRCDRSILNKKRQLCQKHYDRLRKTGTTDGPIYDPNKRCKVPGCNNLGRKHGKNGYRGDKCDQCRRGILPEMRKAYRTNVAHIPELTGHQMRARKNLSLKQSHGITMDEYERLLYVVQGGCCPLCLIDAPTIEYMLGDRFWPVDHNHLCCSEKPYCGSCNRGVLCVGCNAILSEKWQNSEWRMRALEFLGIE